MVYPQAAGIFVTPTTFLFVSRVPPSTGFVLVKICFSGSPYKSYISYIPVTNPVGWGGYFVVKHMLITVFRGENN